MGANFKTRLKDRDLNRLKTAIIALGGMLFLFSMAGCYGPAGLTPRTTGALAGGALGAGGGYLVGSAMGAPATGALVGGVGGALGGYAIGRQIERRNYYDSPYGYNSPPHGYYNSPYNYPGNPYYGY